MSKQTVSPATPERAGPIEIKPPDWLSHEAREIWAKKIRELADLDLPGDIDADALALFCNSVALYAEISGKRRLSLRDHRILQHHARIILQSSDKLGFNSSARVGAQGLICRHRKGLSQNERKFHP